MSQLGWEERVGVASIKGVEARDAAKHVPVPRTTPNTYCHSHLAVFWLIHSGRGILNILRTLEDSYGERPPSSPVLPGM